MIKKQIKYGLQGVTAGVCIGLSTITYLLCSNKLLGAFIFAFGLFVVCKYNLKLCTGMAGYLINKSSKIEGFVVSTFGNLAGMTLLYLLSVLWKPELRAISTQILESKISIMSYQTFISAIFCGMLMFIAVDGFKNSSEVSFALLSIFIAVPIFVINGFDHCVVSMYYVLGARSFVQGIVGLHFFIVAMVGNFMGAILANLMLQKIHYLNGGIYASDQK